jgi:hypothetical protein
MGVGFIDFKALFMGIMLFAVAVLPVYPTLDSSRGLMQKIIALTTPDISKFRSLYPEVS